MRCLFKIIKIMFKDMKVDVPVIRPFPVWNSMIFAFGTVTSIVIPEKFSSWKLPRIRNISNLCTYITSMFKLILLYVLTLFLLGVHIHIDHSAVF